MDLGDAALAGMILGEMDNIRNNQEFGQQRVVEQVIKELMKQGMLLPDYNWEDKEFLDKEEAIVADWFKRHPETKRGTGEFQAKYPDKILGMDTLDKMANMGRITPEEYMILFKEIHNF